MISIRRGVFETNSSSTHSICIFDGPIPEKLPTHVSFCPGEFGWAFEKYDTIHDRASYLYQAVLSQDRWNCGTTESEKLMKQIGDTLAKYGVSCSWGEEITRNEGYLDHGDEAAHIVKALLDDDIKLLNFLFSSKSFVLTGNDNDDGNVSIDVDYPHFEYEK